MTQDAVPWIMLGTAMLAAIAAGFTWLHSWAIRKSMISSNLLNCLTSYTMIMRSKTKAIENESEQQCIDFYRELFDLHWTEFQMWRDGLIPNHIMKSWLMIRRRNYRENLSIQFTKTNGQSINVTYKQVWESLEGAKYFEPEPTDQFLTLINYVHEDKDLNMKKLRKELKKK